MILTSIETITPSGAATVVFDDNIDSTYHEYLCVLYNFGPNSENELRCHLYAGDWTPTVTQNAFESRHSEDDTSVAALTYSTSLDAAQNAMPRNFTRNQGKDGDRSVSGFLHLYNPSSTTFVKHYIWTALFEDTSAAANRTVIAGYVNDSDAVTGIKFDISSGTITGTAELFGIA